MEQMCLLLRTREQCGNLACMQRSVEVQCESVPYRQRRDKGLDFVHRVRCQVGDQTQLILVQLLLAGQDPGTRPVHRNDCPVNKARSFLPYKSSRMSTAVQRGQPTYSACSERHPGTIQSLTQDQAVGMHCGLVPSVSHLLSHLSYCLGVLILSEALHVLQRLLENPAQAVKGTEGWRGMKLLSRTAPQGARHAVLSRIWCAQRWHALCSYTILHLIFAWHLITSSSSLVRVPPGVAVCRNSDGLAARHSVDSQWWSGKVFRHSAVTHGLSCCRGSGLLS